MAHDGTPVILLVEDEPFIRMVTADALIDDGFKVLEAQDAEEALSIVAVASHIDLLFTDINLSAGMDGLQLSVMVEERRPGTKLVVTSGRRHIQDADLPDSGIFLPKPYRPDRMCEVIRAQLSR